MPQHIFQIAEMALQDSLHDYYVNHVEIAPDRMKSAKDVAEAVKDDLLQFLQAKSTFPVSLVPFMNTF